MALRNFRNLASWIQIVWKQKLAIKTIAKTYAVLLTYALRRPSVTWSSIDPFALAHQDTKEIPQLSVIYQKHVRNTNFIEYFSCNIVHIFY